MAKTLIKILSNFNGLYDCFTILLSNKKSNAFLSYDKISHIIFEGLKYNNIYFRNLLDSTLNDYNDYIEISNIQFLLFNKKINININLRELNLHIKKKFLIEKQMDKSIFLNKKKFHCLIILLYLHQLKKDIYHLKNNFIYKYTNIDEYDYTKIIIYMHQNKDIYMNNFIKIFYSFYKFLKLSLMHDNYKYNFVINLKFKKKILKYTNINFKNIIEQTNLHIKKLFE